MIAITTSATSLAGLTALVIGQVVQSSLRERAKKWYKIMFLFTFLMGILAIIFAIDWLFDPQAGEGIFALIFFAFQLSIFTGTVVVF